MRKPRASASEPPSRKSAQRNGGNRARVPSLASFWVLAFAGIAVVLLLAAGAGLYAWNAERSAARLRQLDTCGNLLARDLARRVDGLRTRLEVFSRETQLREALLNGNVQVAERSLREAIPQARAIRLLPAGYGAGTAVTDDLSYAGLDLLRLAEQQRKVTLLEVHRLGEPDVHLAIAAPVLDAAGNAAMGVVHVALPLSWLPTPPPDAGGAGRLVFPQEASARPVTIDTRRGVVLQESDPEVTAAVPHTRLRVAGWAAPVGLGLLYPGIGYALTLALIATVLWLAWRTLKKALESDYAGLVSLVEAAGARRPVRPPDCRLAETQPVLGVVARLLHGVQIASASPAQPTDEKEPPGRATDAAAPGEPAVRTAPKPAAPPPSLAEKGAAPAAMPAGGREAGLSIDPTGIPDAIFRAYDIRGRVGEELTPERMAAIGLAVGSEAAEAGDQTVLVARDTRASSAELAQALIGGLRASGRDVVDLGVAPSPLLYFAACYQGRTSGVVVTGSHNPEEYNGLKVVIAGTTLDSEGIEVLRDRLAGGQFTYGDGEVREGSFIGDYIDRVEKDVAVAYTMKVVVDCGNGTASVLAPRLYEGLGCEVVRMSCDPEAGFPDGRVPDPSRPECLAALRRRVVEEKADLGLAFDTDGDRLGVVDSSGKIIWTDRVLMLLAADVLSRHPGTDVVFDVKSSHHLAAQILRNGGRPVMWRSGHSPLKAKLQETGGLLAGEWSGHIMFRERWYGFDDAIYAGARLLEVLALDPRPSAEVFAVLPEALGTPELLVPLAEGAPARVMAEVLKYADRLEGVGVQTMDGLRAESDHAWGLVRASNTQPALVFRFEGDDEAALGQITDLFRRLMGRAAPDVALPF